jgi:two-component system cell cycle response regulator PopA
MGQSTGAGSQDLGPRARTLVLAKEDRWAGPLCDGLDRLGWRTATARSLGAALAAMQDLGIEAAIIDLSEDAAGGFAAAARMKATYAPRRLPVLALGDPDGSGESGPFDLIMRPPVHPAQIALRLESLTRAAVTEEEFELRSLTLAERGKRLEPPKVDQGPLQILTVGEPAPKFLALSHALRACGAETTGAFTAYTAFDYLHERPFDAVVLWAGEGQADALSIAAGMRRNTRLFHIPTMLYLNSGSDIGPGEAYDRGVTDLATADTPEDETARRAVALARTYRREAAIRTALEKARGSGLMDAATGLFTRDLFASHLARLSTAMHARHRPLSVAVLRITETPEVALMRSEGWLDRAIPQIGSMIGRLVRAEDTVARLAPDVFALALPAASQEAARVAAERIAAVIACTAFDAGDGRTPFSVSFDLGAAELEPGESAAHALERAGARAVARKAS